MIHVFVYGSLKRGFRNHHFLEASGSFVEIVIAYPIDSPDNFGVNMPMNVANDPLEDRLPAHE